MITIDSKLILITGLHIGDADDGMKIGGVDSPVMKREVFCDSEGVIGFDSARKSSEPYIAGSSLKGKVRSLLEYSLGLIRVAKLLDKKQYEVDNKKREYKVGGVIDSQFIEVLNYESNYTMEDKELINKKAKLLILLFGESGANSQDITRVIFRDCFITNAIRKASINSKIELFESKYENVIDRKTGTTIGGGLRQIERVPSAVEFDFNMTIRAFEGDSKELFSNTLLLGLKLLELDALGGSGSRGYGRVRFDELKIDDKLIELNESIKALDEKINNEINKG